MKILEKIFVGSMKAIGVCFILAYSFLDSRFTEKDRLERIGIRK